jgi:hypothetical protein
LAPTLQNFYKRFSPVAFAARKHYVSGAQNGLTLVDVRNAQDLLRGRAEG